MSFLGTRLTKVTLADSCQLLPPRLSLDCTSTCKKRRWYGRGKRDISEWVLPMTERSYRHAWCLFRRKLFWTLCCNYEHPIRIWLCTFLCIYTRKLFLKLFLHFRERSYIYTAPWWGSFINDPSHWQVLCYCYRCDTLYFRSQSETGLSPIWWWFSFWEDNNVTFLWEKECQVVGIPCFLQRTSSIDFPIILSWLLLISIFYYNCV